VHNGHDIREELIPLMLLDEASRLREEDPFTGEWTRLAPTRLVAHRSRFEVDLNRPREKAVYRTPEESWGLRVWEGALPRAVVGRSFALHDEFYDALRRLLDGVVDRSGRFVVSDLQSSCYRRNGPDALPEPAEENPEINLGTGTMDREFWAPVVESFLRDIRGFDFMGRRLDVRENVRFRGGNVPKWIHDNYPGTGCCLAVEVKKFFMDEWTGEPYLDRIDEVGKALAATVPGMLRALERLAAE